MSLTVVAGIIISAASVSTVLLFLLARRAFRHFQIRKLDAVSAQIHRQWREIVRGQVPAEEWRNDSAKCDIVQWIVIQEIGAATDKDRAGLQEFLRTTGLVYRCIEKVHNAHGWNRRRAMLALGSMRLAEAVPPLSEALDDWQLDTRITAVQALGRTYLPEAAEPIIECLLVQGLKVPTDPIINSLVCCFMDQPVKLMPYLRRSQGEARELLARVASELATPEIADEMLPLVGDPRAEVRACAAKAMGVAPLPVAIPALGDLVRDEVWFVRLRAVTALHHVLHPRAIPILLHAVRDPNRLVRVRAAAALAKFEHETAEILQSVVDSQDRYALHAMISALELGGGFEKVLAQLEDPVLHSEAAARLLTALREGAASLWATRPADAAVESVFP